MDEREKRGEIETGEGEWTTRMETCQDMYISISALRNEISTAFCGSRRSSSILPYLK